PSAPLCPYTTLFRSRANRDDPDPAREAHTGGELARQRSEAALRALRLRSAGHESAADDHPPQRRASAVRIRGMVVASDGLSRRRSEEHTSELQSREN